MERLNVTATKIILLIKIIYRDKILGEGLNATVTNLAEIREYGKNTNLINEKLTMAEWKGRAVCYEQASDHRGAGRDPERRRSDEDLHLQHN